MVSGKIKDSNCDFMKITVWGNCVICSTNFQPLSFLELLQVCMRKKFASGTHLPRVGIYNKTVSSERLLSALLNWFMGLFGQNKMYCALRKVVIGHMTCSGRNQTRKSG